MNYQFENLVFEGGGVKGIAYGGALELLEAKGIMPQIKQTSGASAGAIAALLVGPGCSSADVTKILSAMDFKNSSIITAAFSVRSRRLPPVQSIRHRARRLFLSMVARYYQAIYRQAGYYLRAVRSDESGERVQVDLLYRRQPQQRPARGLFASHHAAHESGGRPAHFDVVPVRLRGEEQYWAICASTAA